MKKHLNITELNKSLPFEITQVQCNNNYNSPVHFNVDGVEFSFPQKFDYARMCLNLYRQKQLSITLPKTTNYSIESLQNQSIVLLDASFNLIKEFNIKDTLNFGVEKYLKLISNKSEKAFTGIIKSPEEVEIIYKNMRRGIEQYNLNQTVDYNKKVVISGDNYRFVYVKCNEEPWNVLNYWMIGHKHLNSKVINIKEIKYSPYIY